MPVRESFGGHVLCVCVHMCANASVSCVYYGKQVVVNLPCLRQSHWFVFIACYARLPGGRVVDSPDSASRNTIGDPGLDAAYVGSEHLKLVFTLEWAEHLKSIFTLAQPELCTQNLPSSETCSEVSELKQEGHGHPFSGTNSPCVCLSGTCPPLGAQPCHHLSPS